MHAHQWQPVLQRHRFGIHAFAEARRCGGAAAHGEIFTTNNNTPPINLCESQHEIGWREFNQVAVLVKLGVACSTAYFVKAVCVDQRVDPFTDRQAALSMLLCDSLFPTLRQCGSAAGIQFVGFVFPAHRKDLTCRDCRRQLMLMNGAEASILDL